MKVPVRPEGRDIVRQVNIVFEDGDGGTHAAILPREAA
ncbi:hypothetical protein HDG34_004887 [Paraburkholderia sp. HC6.4b]|nr:hypothetical protein [Paraburkholderia sp. HC6.4b]MBB5455388.1 hypothetical protein [Paraburkholderia sp. Kb1A]